ncbi:MAG: cytochrome P450 [Sphingopyxis sp.]|nr:cytochrome P450 [Sphingopyxis sp.]
MLAPLPSYTFRPTPPTLWDMAVRSISDFASVVPAAILEQPAVQLPGPAAPLVVADPALVRDVLNDRDGRFTRDRFIRRLFRRAWGNGIAAAEGPHWQEQRRAAAPMFRPQTVASNGPAFAAMAARAAQSLPTGQPIEATRLAARIIADILFSVLIDAADDVDTAAVAADVPAYIHRIAGFTARDFLPLPERWHDRLSGIDRDPAVRRLRALARHLASARGARARQQDLIAKLDGVGPIEDNILGLFPAAIDTTVSGIGWTLYALSLRPEWQARIADEARDHRGGWTLDQLPVTRRVVQEVLRLYCPAPFALRSAAVDGDLGGFRFKRGQPISLSIYAMQRHHMVWDNPDAFDPDRFALDRAPPLAWMPFGAGPRMCIAAQFALGEIAAVVARLLMDVTFAPTGPAAKVTLQVTTRSATGLNVTAQRRG